MTELKDKKEKIEQMQNLIVLLNQAAKAYYQESREIMPNHEYDRLYDLLESLEQETGVILSKSPTTRVGYEVLSDLPKEKHPQKMLSLDKTKDVEQLKAGWEIRRAFCHGNLTALLLCSLMKAERWSRRLQEATAK